MCYGHPEVYHGCHKTFVAVHVDFYINEFLQCVFYFHMNMKSICAIESTWEYKP